MSGLGRGCRKSAEFGNSPTPYSTARTVLRGRGGSDAAPLPDINASGLDVAIRKHVRVAGEQGWLDLQMIVALIVLNLAGGDGLEDLERLEEDAGFVQVMREAERGLLPRPDRRALRTRWRKPRRRAVPSPSAMADWLARVPEAPAGKPRPPRRRTHPGEAWPSPPPWA